MQHDTGVPNQGNFACTALGEERCMYIQVHMCVSVGINNIDYLKYGPIFFAMHKAPSWEPPHQEQRRI